MKGRWKRWLVCAAMGGAVSATGTVRGQAPVPVWTTGLWRVEQRGLDLPTRLVRLELKAAARTGQANLLAYESAPDGHDRLWGTAPLDLPRHSGEPARAEWTDGPTLVTFLVRPEPAGALTAIVRQRDRGRVPASPDRVRQCVLVRPDERPVVNAPFLPARRFDPAPARPARGEPGVIYVVAADGSGLRAVAVPDGYARAAHPAWSPDGNRLAFTGFDASGREPLVRVIPLAGGPAVAVAGGIAPRWTHDGSSLVYMASGRADFATDWTAPGRNEERIERIVLTGPDAGRAEILARGTWPHPAPGDDRLAFAARVGTTWDIYIRSADGARALRLTDDPATDTYPCWSPDGTAIVFLSDRGNRWDLWEVPADGSAPPRRLSDVLKREDEPDLAPDGRHVAFTEGLAQRDSQILILDLPSGTVRPLLERAQGDRNPAWSRDGLWLAFASRRPAPLLPMPAGR